MGVAIDMKCMILNFTAALTVASLLAACGGGVAGHTYGGDDCLYDKLEFRSGGKVFISISMMGNEIVNAGTYELDGDRVIVSDGARSAVMTRKDDGSLEAGMLGTCVRID